MEKEFCFCFSTLIDNSEFSDIKFILRDNQVVYGHKFILKQSCSFFKNVKQNSMKANFTKSTFLHGIYFLYTGELKEDLRYDELIELLDFSGFFMLENLKNIIFAIIEVNSDEFLESEHFLNISHNNLILLLSSESFKVSNELKILRRVYEWQRKNNSEDFQDILECIRYTLIPISVLENFEYQINKKIIIKVLKALIKNKLEEPRGGPTLFEYEHDFDENGIFYFLGLKDGQWVNPMLSGQINIKQFPMIGTSISGGKISDLVERNSSSMFMFSSLECGYIIDFGTRSVILTQYTLRLFSQNCSYLMEWDIHGSNDDEIYDLIQSYKYNQSPFTHGNQSNTFKIDLQQKYYRFIKITQKKNDTNFNFGLCQIEFYGKLY